MSYALFLGCSVPVRAMNYEMSVRKVAARLGVELVDIEDFGCCGYPIEAVSGLTAAAMAAGNLALAAARGLPVVSLCSACSGFLAETAHKLEHDGELRRRVNELLEPRGLQYGKDGPVRVSHFTRVLMDDVSPEKIRREVTAPLENVKVAAHYGCHYLRPRSLTEDLEDPENPRSLDELIRATGSKSVFYEGRLDCCGGGILGIKEDTALRVAKKKLDSVTREDVDAMVTICPFCSVMFEGSQKKIEKTFETTYNLPVLYYPQLLGLAMGLDPDELGFKMNRVKAKALLEKIGSP